MPPLNTVAANRYVLSGNRSGSTIQVSFTTELSASGTVLSYTAGGETSIFIPGQLSTDNLDIGTLVSVSLGSGGEPIRTAQVLTVLIPEVLFSTSASPSPGSTEGVDIATFLVFTQVSTPGGPHFLPAAAQSYEVVMMQGKAYLDTI
jgi:hypothetical protein